MGGLRPPRPVAGISPDGRDIRVRAAEALRRKDPLTAARPRRTIAAAGQAYFAAMGAPTA